MIERPQRSLLLIPAIAFLAVLPLILYGCSCGHDFDFHLVSWFEAATQIAHGNLHPHWAFTPAWNAGEPRFVFYPPLSWYLGALLGMILPWAATPIVYTWLCLTGAGLACFSLLRDFAPPRTALLLSAAYLVNPYMLFTAYERTAYGELLAAAWFPLLLHGILRERVSVPRLALPLALLWLSNAPAAVLATYSLAILAAARLIFARERTALTRTTVAGTLLGLALAAFYILPAAYERRYIEQSLDRAQSALITDNFLFHHTADAAHDAVLHTASAIATGLLVITAAALVLAFFRSPRERRTLVPLAGLTACIAFLLTPFSTFIWLHAPNLAFLQFPWRFLAILTPALALTIAMAVGSKSLRGMWTLVPAILLNPVILFSYQAFYQPCDEQDTVAARLALFHSPAGTEATDDYIPNTVDDEDTLKPTNPPFWLAQNPEDAPPSSALPAPLHWPLDLNPAVPRVLILNLRDYPAWCLTRNGTLLPTRLERPDGLLATPLPAGSAHLVLTYTRTPDQTAGSVITVLALALLLYLILRRRRS